MRIGGLHKNSLIDFPGRLSAVIFTRGCNFRCAYCHNPGLVYPEKYGPLIEEDLVLSFLSNRRGLIDSVVITGGEPLLQPDIERFLRRIKDMGYPIKLDTNGSMPERLQHLINSGLIDYVAMDYKAPLRSYNRVIQVNIDTEKITHSVTLIVSSGIEYEIRTTLYSSLSMNSVIDIIAELKQLGVECYYLQIFRSFDKASKILQPSGIDIQYLKEYMLCRFWKWGLRSCEYVVNKSHIADELV
ncbi:MAG: anaerobic ribonucleoside-triphosphate reductase activating protein [Nitrospirae bacterium]|nr:anaerobic ribonucleoside-triphosphate reductase activating protein [Nitrospirota bacterium]